jgi:hypothetical protein
LLVKLAAKGNCFNGLWAIDKLFYCLIEKQFGLKARLSGILPIPLTVVQQSTVSALPRNTLLPALQLLKLVATKGQMCISDMVFIQDGWLLYYRS